MKRNLRKPKIEKPERFDIVRAFITQLLQIRLNESGLFQRSDYSSR